MPVRFFENKVFKFKTKFGSKIKRPLSIVVSFLIAILVISVIVVIVVPQISKTITDATSSIPEFVKNTTTIIQEKFKLKSEWQREMNYVKEASESWETLVTYISKYLPTDMFKSVNVVYDFVKGVFSSFLTGIISIVFCIYSILQKEKIKKFFDGVIRTFFSKKQQGRIYKVTMLLHSNFEDFVFGQCMECFVVASVFTIIALIFGFKCAVIVGPVMLVLALIPYIGNIVSCIIGIVLTLAMESPTRAILFAVLFGLVQLLDGYFLYPRVMGLKVKMPPLLIFVASITGAGLFGIFGMILSIPISTTIYMLITEKIENSTKKHIEKDCVDKNQKSTV